MGATGVIILLALVGAAIVLCLGTGYSISTYNRVKVLDVINSGGRVFVNGTSCVSGEPRRVAAFRVRDTAAYVLYANSVPCHPNNGDEALYPASHLGSFSKGLPHDSLGIVAPSAYASLLLAVETGVPAHFNLIPLGGSRLLLNPQAGLAFSLVGADSNSFYAKPSPAFASAQFAHELAENYWMALARDVSFDSYGVDSITMNAAVELNTYPDYGGPLPTVAGTNLFRGLAPGCSLGPFVSQFLYHPVNLGPVTLDQRSYPPIAGSNYMTIWTEFIAIQNGLPPSGPGVTYETLPKYITNGRDLIHYVHTDVLFRSFQNAAIMLVNWNAPLKPAVPYVTTLLNQAGWATFGAPALYASLAEAAEEALKATWFQKWQVHRKLRPEEAGGRVDRVKTNLASWPLNPDILGSAAVTAMHTQFGTYLLSQAYPEGSSLDPSYTAGSAAAAGACATILKFWYQESHAIQYPLMPTPGNASSLSNYTGPDSLTVGGELNKLAWNVAVAHNMAGVNWRSDAAEALKLGEQVAVALIRNKRATFNEVLSPWTATGFDGNLIVIH